MYQELSETNTVVLTDQASYALSLVLFELPFVVGAVADAAVVAGDAFA